MKTLYYWSQKPKENKAKELQIYTSLYLTPKLEFILNLSQSEYDTNIFNFNINIFGLFGFNIDKNKKTDHAGLSIELNLFGLVSYYNHYDIRHWNDENDTWEVYN